MPIHRRILLVVLALALTVPLAACGAHHDRQVADSEAIHLEIGGLTWQVQISRQLNSEDSEDEAYLVDLPENQPELAGDETWFAVFVRAWNLTDETQQPVREFKVIDTVGDEYYPVQLGPDNIFAYRALPVSPSETKPEQDTIALTAPAGGSLLLFRMPNASLANRPLELVTSPPDEPDREYTFTLDV